MVGVTRGGGGGKLLGEWKLIRASAFWGLLARMASALKIKCPTLTLQPIKTSSAGQISTITSEWPNHQGMPKQAAHGQTELFYSQKQYRDCTDF